MKRSCVRQRVAAALALWAGLLLCFVPGSSAVAGPIALSDILDIDPLGYECVPSQYFDDTPDGSAPIAFSLSGKTRLPRTCLPEPCARALTRAELSGITGTEPILARFSEEWDDYYSRYADHCVREVTVSRPRTNDFWKPIINRAQSTQRIGIPTSSRLIPFVPGGFSVPTFEPQPTLISFIPEVKSIGPEIGPSPVPIPASGVLLGGLLLIGAIGGRKRLKR
ncbi:MAG: hypothetical protein AAFQ64_14700 [Pseudomonadota bacterium]